MFLFYLTFKENVKEWSGNGESYILHRCEGCVDMFWRKTEDSELYSMKYVRMEETSVGSI